MRPARASPRRPPSADFRKFTGARKSARRASCRNQDLRDYRIFRIPRSHHLRGKRSSPTPNRIGEIFGRGEKRKPGENEILKIPPIP